MFLHFEDWSGFTWILVNKGLPNEGKIIKVFATDTDPRDEFNDPNITVVEVSDETLGEIGVFISLRVEQSLETRVFSDIGKKITRSLFRFAWNNGFAQSGFVILKQKYPLKNHPIDIIDGFDYGVKNPYYLHLDIFLPESLPTLKGVVDYDDPLKMVAPMKGHR